MFDNIDPENSQINNPGNEEESSSAGEKQPSGGKTAEVDNEFINTLYEIAGTQPPEDVSLEDLKTILKKVKSRVDLAFSSQKLKDSLQEGEESEEKIEIDDSVRPKTVLVVDDLGIVTIQLASLFKKIGFEVTTSRELFDAIEKYKTQDYGYAVVDLFIPTEREGYILIDEIKKLSLICRLDTKIIVMSASNKKEHKDKCKSKGAHIFIEKTSGWQNKIVDFITGKEVN